jgi:hypothetical protein
VLTPWAIAPKWYGRFSEGRAVSQASVLGIFNISANIHHCSQANIDYVVASALNAVKPDDVVASYDIACQWQPNLFNRATHLDPVARVTLLRLLQGKSISFCCPKMHSPSHKEECRYKYSFNYRYGVGRTDGEAIERFWSAILGATGSTKEMRLGHRHDVLDDIFQQYNWSKTINFRESNSAHLCAYAHCGPSR